MVDTGKLESKLKLVRDAKRFAVEKLGITENPSFENVGDNGAFYGVYVAWKHCLDSPFGDAYGRVCFSNEQKAKRYQIKNERRGLDTNFVIWNATSRMDCPITSSLLSKSETRIVEIVLHENFHIHVDIENMWVPRCIEETLSQIFAYFGGLLFFEGRILVIRDIEEKFQNRLKFYDFINKYIGELIEAYSHGVEEGRSLLGVAQQEAIKSGIKTNLAVNNTFFLSQWCYAVATRVGYELLLGRHPKEYTTRPEIRTLTERLPKDPEGKSQMMGLPYLLG